MTTEMTFEDIDLTIEYDFYKEEAGDYLTAANPPSVDIQSVIVAGVDVFDILSNNVLMEIEVNLYQLHEDDE